MMAPELVVVGTSLGGAHALSIMLSALPPDFPASLVIAQHRAKDAPSTLDSFLQSYCALPVCEVVDKAPIVAGHVYLAPADYHVLVEPGALALSTEAPVVHARPSIDVLFESAADAYAERTVGVLMTGASQDGAQGLARIKQRGGLAIVQSPATAQCVVMPEAALVATQVDWILPLAEIGPHLVSLCCATWSTFQPQRAQRTQR